MAATTIRRSVALVASAAILASLAVATVAAPASAAKPRCAGKTATIVGTAKGEVIRGTNKADVIVARGGNDRIYGRGGNDIICGGAGHDLIVGGPGSDRVYGAAGRDRLRGGPGSDRLYGGIANDSFNGGTGRDICRQGPGAGPLVNCEVPAPTAAPTPTPPPTPPPTPLNADLEVRIVLCINCAVSGQNFQVAVRVTNNGPDAVSYVLSHELEGAPGYEFASDFYCDTVTSASGPKPTLAAGASDDLSYMFNCTDIRDTDDVPAGIVFTVHAMHAGTDDPGVNNTVSEPYDVSR